MKSDKDHIKDVFSSKLKGFEADLPPSLWDKIEADLPVQAPIKVPLKKPVYKMLSWVSAAAAVIFAILYFMPQDTENAYVARLIEDKSIKKNHSFAQFRNELSKEESSKEYVKPVAVKPTLGLLASSVTASHVGKVKTISSTESLLPKASSIDNVTAVGLIKEDIVVNEEPEAVYVAEANESADFQPKDPDFERDLKAKIASFEAAGENSANILADNSIPTKSETKGKSSKGIAIGVGGGSGLSKADDVANTFRYAHAALATEGLYTLRSQQFKLEHKQPVSFGIAVNKRITDKISLESGIVYTYVSAKIRLAGNQEYNQNDEQYFHYLGIPLSVNYKFAEWKKAQFYTSLGGMIQKDFYGRIKSESSIDDLLNSERYAKRNISQSKPQFSATALMGVSYPLYNKLSVYTTFGGAYYFQANNEYETIFSDRKWLFNFNLGLKFGF